LWEKIAAGQGHSLGLLTDATAWAWGYNGFGELGIGSQVDVHFPVNVSCINVGIELAGSKNSVEIYPNPATEYLNILSDLNQNMDRITITDSTGKKVLDIPGNTYQINVSMLNSGMYLLRMVSKGSSRALRFVKK